MTTAAPPSALMYTGSLNHGPVDRRHAQPAAPRRAPRSREMDGVWVGTGSQDAGVCRHHGSASCGDRSANGRGCCRRVHGNGHSTAAPLLNLIRRIICGGAPQEPYL